LAKELPCEFVGLEVLVFFNPGGGDLQESRPPGIPYGIGCLGGTPGRRGGHPWARNREMRPDTAEWLGASSHGGPLDIYGARPATSLAYSWLRSDLARVAWTNWH
jgi:hypothetical protein